MSSLKRSHNCGDLRLKDAGLQVVLAGWVNARRDHGRLVFVDLRDRSGLAQIVFDPLIDEISHAKAHQIRNEYVLAVKGEVRARPKGTINPNLPTGEIEVAAYELEVLNESKTPPFEIEDEVKASEDLRLAFRYLDLRRAPMQQRLILRHKLYQSTRRFLSKQGFLEIETPFLIKSTPEGARDFLVPSRLNPGQFYALPQSPQLFKQILMVAGFERYFQITKCFRDEDLRADRQPEFTQIDIEASFINEEDIYQLIEGLLSKLFKDLLGIDISVPFLRLTYEEVIDRFGTARPDTRFSLELFDGTKALEGAGFKVFDQIIESGGQVKGILVPGGASFSRKDIEELTAYISIYQAKGLAYFKVTEKGLESPIAKFFSQEKKDELIRTAKAKVGDIIFFVADTPKVVNESLSKLRLYLANKLSLIPKERFDFVWITDFPLFDFDEEGLKPNHHPFTAVREQDYPLLDTFPQRAKARAYDIILNGVEIGGGSIRIHQSSRQKKIFDLLGIGKKEAIEKFGFLLNAFEYGAPPHGGIALGLDRLLSVMLGLDSIREVIAFPKTQKGTCLMTGAPFEVEEIQLKELSIRTFLPCDSIPA